MRTTDVGAVVAAITNDGEKESRNNFSYHGDVCPEVFVVRLLALVILSVMHDKITGIECGP